MLHPRSSKHAPGQSPFVGSKGQSVSSKIHSAASSVFDLPIAQDTAQSRDALAQSIPPSLTSQHEDESPSYLVVSGGTGCNGIVSAFGSNVTYVLPVSDNGGSSSEVRRRTAPSVASTYPLLDLDYSRIGRVLWPRVTWLVLIPFPRLRRSLDWCVSTQI